MRVRYLFIYLFIYLFRLSNHLNKLKIVRLAGTQYNDAILSKWIDCAKNLKTCDGIVHLDIGQTAVTKQHVSSSLSSLSSSSSSSSSSLLFSKMTTLRLDGIAMKDMDGDFLLPLTRLQKLV